MKINCIKHLILHSIRLIVVLTIPTGLFTSCKNTNNEKAELTNRNQLEISTDLSSKLTNGQRIKITIEGVDLIMIGVEGGEFEMGASAEQIADASESEFPSHKVRLNGYYISETEISQLLWEKIMGENPSRNKGEKLPVEMVCWEDCNRFLKRLNSVSGRNFRLPTEAEWEYAARGGNLSQGYKYAGSDSIEDVSWYCDNSMSSTHDVGTKKPNELGIYDMSGNVWEWCSDRYKKYDPDTLNNSSEITDGKYRLLRGGCWYSNAESCRVSYRHFIIPEYWNNYGGIRLVLSPE